MTRMYGMQYYSDCNVLCLFETLFLYYFGCLNHSLVVCWFKWWETCLLEVKMKVFSLEMFPFGLISKAFFTQAKVWRC